LGDFAKGDFDAAVSTGPRRNAEIRFHRDPALGAVYLQGPRVQGDDPEVSCRTSRSVAPNPTAFLAGDDAEFVVVLVDGPGGRTKSATSSAGRSVWLYK